ncbi:unnamed protein product, partial [Ectocarpus sp. 4 AP-2014]
WDEKKTEEKQAVLLLLLLLLLLWSKYSVLLEEPVWRLRFHLSSCRTRSAREKGHPPAALLLIAKVKVSCRVRTTMQARPTAQTLTYPDARHHHTLTVPLSLSSADPRIQPRIYF